jgi:hypothetical protein
MGNRHAGSTVDPLVDNLPLLQSIGLGQTILSNDRCGNDKDRISVRFFPDFGTILVV